MAAVQRQRAAHHLIVIMAASRATNHFACMWQPGCYTRAFVVQKLSHDASGSIDARASLDKAERAGAIPLAKVAVYIVE